MSPGCGAGPLLEVLRDRGAIVTGIEPSARMLQLVRQRLGDGVTLHQGALGGDPLPFPDGAFDDAVACLVLHYLEDWKAPLAELRRVLVPGGRLIVAVNHPLVYKLLYPDAHYSVISQYSEDNTFSGQSAVLTYWHRPLQTRPRRGANSSSRLAQTLAQAERHAGSAAGRAPRLSLATGP